MRKDIIEAHQRIIIYAGAPDEVNRFDNRIGGVRRGVMTTKPKAVRKIRGNNRIFDRMSLGSSSNQKYSSGPVSRKIISRNQYLEIDTNI